MLEFFQSLRMDWDSFLGETERESITDINYRLLAICLHAPIEDDEFLVLYTESIIELAQ